MAAQASSDSQNRDAITPPFQPNPIEPQNRPRRQKSMWFHI
jgi:hypothetical protein